MRTRILYICDSLCIGGAEKALADILCYLDYQKFEVQVVLLKNENAFEHLLRHLPVEIRSLEMSRMFPKTLGDAKKMLRLFSIIREFDPDIIHSQGQDPDLYAQCARMFFNRYIVINTFHSIDVLRSDASRVKFSYRFKLGLENFMIRYTDKVIVVSEGVKEYAANTRSMPLWKIEYIRNAIPPLERTMEKGERKERQLGLAGRKVVGFVGRLFYHKNLFTAIDAFARVRERIPDVDLVIVGDGILRRRLEEFALQKSVGEKVHFVGSQQDVQSFYEMFDVFILPSFTEGLPLSMLEAMSLHVPVVASAIAGIVGIIQNEQSGLLVRPPDGKYLAEAITGDSRAAFYVDEAQSKELADALCRILSDEEFACRLAGNAYDIFLKEYSLGANIKKLEHLYESVGHSRSRRTISTQNA